MSQSRTFDHSQLWEKALEQYRKELNDGNDYESVIGVSSMEDLLAQARNLEPRGARNQNILSSLSRLEPMLLHINDFSAVTALFLGANAKSAALVWGSIRIILTVLPCLLSGFATLISLTVDLACWGRNDTGYTQHARRIKHVTATVSNL